MPADSAARLAPAEHRRLVGILGRLGSDHDGERAAAGLLATRLLRDRGLSWDQVVPAPDAPPAGPPGAADALADLDLCKRRWNDLNSWHRQFIVGVSGQTRPMSPAQRAKVAEAAGSLRARGLA